MDDLYKSQSAHWRFKTPFFLNHGSFGATPVAVLDYKARLDAEIDADRDHMFRFMIPEKHEEARRAVAAFVNAPESDVVLLDNVTEALGCVLHSLSFEPGDEIVITNHGYPPFNGFFREIARRRGIKFVVARIPFPIDNERQAIDPVLAAVTSRTKLAIIDHVTSPTALVLPIADIVKALAAKGIDTFVDGAHGIGFMELDMAALGAAYYTSNCHKWLCAPISSAFLYVRPDRQEDIIPAISQYVAAEHPFATRFNWQGTKSLSARLCIPQTMRYMAELHPGGWPGIYRRNRALALAAREFLCEKFGAPLTCPESMVGCMSSVPLGPFDFPAGEQHSFHKRMYDRFGYAINAPGFEGAYYLRPSPHLYNSLADYERMAEDLQALLADL